MRIFVHGGNEAERGLVERALLAAGCTLAPTAAESDLLLSVNDARGDALSREGTHLDLAASIARRGRRTTRLSRIEVALLAVLMRSDRPLGRLDLIAAVWGYGFDPGTNIVAVHVARLRAKLGQGAIVLDRNGYRIGVEESAC